MRKSIVLGIAITAVLIISTAVAFSYPGWGKGRLWTWDKAKVVTLKGKVTDAEEPIVTMEADGREYILLLGPFWYWQEKGFTLEKDSDIEVTGIVEEAGGNLFVHPQKIKSGEKTIELRDENGIPVWAGPRYGRKGGYGRPGWGYGPGWRGYGRYGWRGHGPCWDWRW